MMKDQRISSYQLFCLAFLFLFGSTTILQSITAAGRDTWISTLLATGAGIPVILMVTFLAGRFPGKSLIEYIPELFGKIPGKVLGLAYLWYFLHLSSLVLRNFGDFLSTVIFPETPSEIFNLTMGLLIAYMVYKGIEVTSRVGEFVLPIFMAIFVLASTTVTLSKTIDFQNLKPMLENGLGKVLLGTVPIAAFPFQELIVFSMVIPYIKPKSKNGLIMAAALGLTGILLTTTMVQSIAILGTYMSTLIFPRFFTIRLLTAGDFIQRIEPIIITAWLMGGIIKMGICLHAFVAGTCQLLGIKENKIFVVPAAFMMIAITDSLYKDVAEMLNFAVNIYPIYAFPFETAFPVLMVILALVRGKKNKSSQNNNSNQGQGSNNQNTNNSNSAKGNNNNNNNNNSNSAKANSNNNNNTNNSNSATVTAAKKAKTNPIRRTTTRV